MALSHADASVDNSSAAEKFVYSTDRSVLKSDCSSSSTQIGYGILGPTPPSLRPISPPLKNVKCYKCGTRSHMAHDCISGRYKRPSKATLWKATSFSAFPHVTMRQPVSNFASSDSMANECISGGCKRPSKATKREATSVLASPLAKKKEALSKLASTSRKKGKSNFYLNFPFLSFFF